MCRCTVIQVAAALIDSFRRQRRGHVRCLILSELSAKPLIVPRGKRRLVDCVTCLSAYRAVVEKLLGSWILVDSFQEAAAFQRDSDSRWNCVTLDGVLFWANGEVRTQRLWGMGLSSK